MLEARIGGERHTAPKDVERHATQKELLAKKGTAPEPVIIAKTREGYDLIEGWHRVIQELIKFPEGYERKAWTFQST